MTPAPAHPLLHHKASVTLDAGSLAVEPPRFVVIAPDDYQGFTLREIAAGVYTLATESE